MSYEKSKLASRKVKNLTEHAEYLPASIQVAKAEKLSTRLAGATHKPCTNKRESAKPGRKNEWCGTKKRNHSSS